VRQDSRAVAEPEAKQVRGLPHALRSVGTAAAEPDTGISSSAAAISL
jgi:hypothetical protein